MVMFIFSPATYYTSSMINIEIPSVGVRFNPVGGHLDEVRFTVSGTTLKPMHQAHWRTGENNNGVPEELDASIPQVLRSLAGDFFCAPFAADDLTNGPIHGPPANGLWSEIHRMQDAQGGVAVDFGLDSSLLGADILKRITLKSGHPVVYQSHRFMGGEGAIPFAHHPMIRVDDDARLSTSPKQFGMTSALPVESDPALGRSLLMYPQEFDNLSSVRAVDGRIVNLRNLPSPEGYEDVVHLFEQNNSEFGWAAVVARANGFVFFTVRNPRVMPATTLWLSNAGRDYPPFSGRHRNVVGIEDGCHFLAQGYLASVAHNTLNVRGIATALRLNPNGETEVKHAFGAFPMPNGWSEVADVRYAEGHLHFHDVSGGAVAIAFDAGLAGVA
jgi:hypothetical protein